MSEDLFPVFLKLAGRPVLVVGAGPVAAGKIAALLPTGAELRVVAPDISDAAAALGVAIAQRPFTPKDLDGVWLVVAAAPPAVNRRVARAAARRRVFVNAVDDPANASAYLGGVVRRDGVTIAISTDGRAPALAGLLREGLGAMLPAAFDGWLRASDRLRRQWRRRATPMTSRRPELLTVLNGLYQPARARAERTS